ncbi:MAG TPA: response regulator [Planctomycetaceae bacterium]|jgi:FixJ family two-component response regulator|nr:response regulator [Planctomycetaceae bacterium]
MKSPRAQQTVFIVDDDPAIRKSLQLLIQLIGLPVRTFPSAASFLDTYQPGDAGCLILDIQMRGMSGLDLQQELIRRSFDIPIIVLTGYGDVPSAIRALKTGAVEFLEKPVEDDVLLNHVRRALALEAQHRSQRTEHDIVRERIGRLTPRELEVLRRVIDGLSSKEIGYRLHVSCKTVEAHRLRIMKKMEAESVAELVRLVVGVETRDPGRSASDS